MMRLPIRSFALFVMAVSFVIYTPSRALAETGNPSVGEAHHEYQRFVSISNETDLELDPYWSDYLSADPDQDFASFVRERYEFKRHLGVGLVAGGLVVGVSGFILAMAGLPYGMCILDSDCDTSKAYAMAGTGLALMLSGTAAWISGAFLWDIFQKRLKKLDPYLYQEGEQRAALQLVSAGPLIAADGQSGGLAMAFAF